MLYFHNQQTSITGPDMQAENQHQLIVNTAAKTRIFRSLINHPLKYFDINQVLNETQLPHDVFFDALTQLINENAPIHYHGNTQIFYEPNELHLHPDEIATQLKTQWWGNKIYYADTMRSTIDTAKQIIKQTVPDITPLNGSVIISNQQLQGRGRQGSTWVSPPGQDLLLTFLIFNNHWQPSPALLSLYIATAVARVLDTAYNLPVQIKWPNDIMINSKKVGGVLAEVNHSQKVLLLSIGLNVHSHPEHWHSDFRHQTTSLSVEKPHEEWQRSVLLAQCGILWEVLWQQTQKDQGETVRSYWRRYSTMLRQTIQINYRGKHLSGFAKDIDEHGRLIFIADTGDVIHLLLEDAHNLRLMSS